MQKTTRSNRFLYPLWFRFVYLWMPYMVILVSAPVFLVWRTTWLVVPYIALLLILQFLSERYLLRLLPTEIRVEDDHVSLYRFRRYGEFEMEQVEEVNPNVISPFEILAVGWTRVRFRENSRTSNFYIAPYLESYLELVDLLTATAPQRPSYAVSAFAYRTAALWQFRLGMFFMHIWALVFIVPALQHLCRDVRVAIIPALISAVLVLIDWEVARGTPVRIVFEGNERAILHFLFGNQSVLRSGEVTEVMPGSRIAGLRVPASRGVTLRTTSGTLLYIAPSFTDYTELVHRLRQLMSN